MCDGVLIQGAAVSEPFVTDATLICFLSSVYKAVPLQSVGPRK